MKFQQKLAFRTQLADIAHHYNEDSDENRHEISKESQCMLHVIHISDVCPLNYFLGINYHVAHENQQSKVQLHMQQTNRD